MLRGALKKKLREIHKEMTDQDYRIDKLKKQEAIERKKANKNKEETRLKKQIAKHKSAGRTQGGFSMPFEHLANLDAPRKKKKEKKGFDNPWGGIW